ncbi:NYN domain-containing protein [Bradyrhizobium valentinum]|uniref:LabA-like NYN domain-containing protein n=1 Tax=Bradyrhizobium valentinum TaxID=1518501 RepID=UPI0009E9409B|nr:NYN domain-containing protein [Bradyrhizobium valentinum]
MSSKSNRIALFIDGANLHATARTLGFDIDFKRLLKEFEGRDSLLRAFYYTAVIEDQEYSSLRPLTDWLSYNGYTVVTKAVKEFTDAGGRRKVKGSMHVELAVDAMDLADQIDQMVLFSGDGDFRALVEAVQRRGVRVTVISTISSQPPMIADELRRQADVFTDLVELQSSLARDQSGRPARAASGAAVPADAKFPRAGDRDDNSQARGPNVLDRNFHLCPLRINRVDAVAFWQS